MDDFDLRDMLSPPLRCCAEEAAGAEGAHAGEAVRPAAPEMVLGMAYVPAQAWGDLYAPEEGFPRGTVFRGLDYPFEGRARK